MKYLSACPVGIWRSCNGGPGIKTHLRHAIATAEKASGTLSAGRASCAALPVAAIEHQVRPFTRPPGGRRAMAAYEDGRNIMNIALGDGAQFRVFDGSEAPLANRQAHSRSLPCVRSARMDRSKARHEEEAGLGSASV